MTEKQNGYRADLAKLEKLARNKNYDELESAWLAAIEDESVRVEDLLPTLRVLARQNESKQTESLLWFLLTARAELKGPEEALQVAREVSDFLPDSEVLREEIACLLQKAYTSFPGIETLTNMTVNRLDISIPVALQRMETFLTLCPGTYVFDNDLRKCGRVLGTDAEREVLAVSFQNEERSYDSLLVEELDLLGADDFRALAIFDRSRLEGLAQDDPVELVRLVLKAFGPRLSFRNLKSRLAAIVPAESWSKWWSNAKPQIKLSSTIEMSQGTQPTFLLRRRPIVYEDRLRAQFEATASIEDRLVLALDYLSETSESTTSGSGLMGFLAGGLAQYVDDPMNERSTNVLGVLAVIAEIRERYPDVAPAPQCSVEQLLSDESDLSSLVRSVQSDDIVKCVLTFVSDALPERWHELYAAAMPDCSQGVCEWIAKDLSQNGHEGSLATSATAIIENPSRHAGALVWLWKAVCAGKFPEALASVDRVAVAFKLFSAAGRLARPASDQKAQQKLLSQVRAAISAKKYSVLQDVMKEADTDRAKEIRDIVERSAGISEQARSQVTEIIREIHPAIFAQALPPWEEDAIYTTEAGLKRQQGELAHLVNVVMAENSKAIGEAAAQGDLSENAEFTAALEERDRLTERASRVQAQIKKARPITRSMAEGQTVTVGSEVRTMELASEQVETFTFLGPWDADLNKQIYSYQAPLGMAFMGKGIGEVVVFGAGAEERKWKITEIRPGI